MAFGQFLEELYAPMGGVRVRAMFGGLGVFKGDVMFALVADDVLYLRVDEASVGAYAAEGSERFVYKGMKGREISMGYWRLPERLYDDPDEFVAWSEAALGGARRAAAEKASGRKPAAAKPRRPPPAGPGPAASKAIGRPSGRRE